MVAVKRRGGDEWDAATFHLADMTRLGSESWQQVARVLGWIGRGMEGREVVFERDGANVYETMDNGDYRPDTKLYGGLCSLVNEHLRVVAPSCVYGSNNAYLSTVLAALVRSANTAQVSFVTTSNPVIPPRHAVRVVEGPF